MARPRKEDAAKRGDQFTLRLTSAERVVIEANAAFLGISPTAFIRLRALEKNMPPAKTEARAAAVHATALLRIGNNLNQLTRHTHAGKPLLEGELQFCLTRIHELLDQLYDSPPDARRTVVQGGGPLLPAR